LDINSKREELRLKAVLNNVYTEIFGSKRQEVKKKKKKKKKLYNEKIHTL
jgi:hypothetical protein